MAYPHCTRSPSIFKSFSHQVNVLSPESKHLVGSEDCLYLNVFTPHLPGAGRSALFPVIVWLHGEIKIDREQILYNANFNGSHFQAALFASVPTTAGSMGPTYCLRKTASSS